VVEEEKDARLKGFYIHPDLYGAPQEKQIEWARHPEMMKQMKAKREAHPARPSSPRTPVLPLRAAPAVGPVSKPRATYPFDFAFAKGEEAAEGEN
jgi:hypothetical protein